MWTVCTILVSPDGDTPIGWLVMDRRSGAFAVIQRPVNDGEAASVDGRWYAFLRQLYDSMTGTD